MCGIAGVILRSGRPDEVALRLAVQRLRHRGPDDSGIHFVDSVALAHTRLSIIDLSGGHQPILDTSGDCALVANGEVYNYVELREDLARQGETFLTHSDSETILHCYRRYGVSGFERLNGMFAFALYSRREGLLILGRDRLGIKPLYYAQLPDRICFASELKALFPLLPFQPEITPAGLAQFLEIGYCSGEDTLVKGVKRLPPGSVLAIDRSLRLTHTRFWSPASVAPRTLSIDEAEEELDALFTQVLREHMRSDVPYGLFLSGGVDSGALLGGLSHLGAGRIKTFSVGYQGDPDADELEDARRTAEHFGSEHCELKLDPSRVLRALPVSVWAADDLIYDPATLPTALMAQRAAQDLKVVFTGEGGDEVFAGYGRYRRSRPQWLLKRLLALFGPGYVRRSRWPRALRHSAYGERLRRARGDIAAPLTRAWRETPRHWSDLSKAQYADLRTELADRLLVKADRMLMAFGLEGRVPYLDHRIVELGLALPDDLKVQGRVGKRLLKRWAQHYLPPHHLARPKKGFGVPLAEPFQGPFLERLGERLAADRAISTWFKPEAVPTLVARQRARGDAEEPLLQLTQIALWYQLLIEHPDRRPGADEALLDWLA